MLTNPISGFILDIHSLVCQSTFYSSLEVYRRELVYFVTTLDSSFSITTSSWNYDTTRNTTIAKFGTKVADYVRIFWQSSDLSLFEPSYAAALASRLKIDTAQLGASGTVSTTHTPGQTLANPSPGPISSIPAPTSAPAMPSSLRPATTAGISVGAISGAAILIALILFVYKWRQNRKQARVTCTDQEATTAPDLAELQGDEEKGKRAGELETREGICDLPSPVPESDTASTWKDRRGLEDELVLRK